MKIFVLYGDNEEALAKRLKLLTYEAKMKGFDIQWVDGSQGLNVQNYSQGLFGESLYIFENVSRLTGKEIATLSKNIPGNIIFFQKGTIPKRILDIFPQGARIEQFKLPTIIYRFLESFYPKNAKSALAILHKMSKTQPDELTLHLLAKHLHDLLLVKLDETGLEYPDWRMLKLAAQASKYSQSQLLRLIKLLARIDLDIKSSKARLVSSLDLLISTELE